MQSNSDNSLHNSNSNSNSHRNKKIDTQREFDQDQNLNGSEMHLREYYENEDKGKIMISDSGNLAEFNEYRGESAGQKRGMGEEKEGGDGEREEVNPPNEISTGPKDNKIDDENNTNFEDLEREEMENEFELVKSLNELKEQNKKLKAVNNYQKIKIESLEGELDKALNKIKLLEIEDEENKGNNKGEKGDKTLINKNAKYLNQINSLNLQIDKYKSLIQEKKSEYAILLEKFNDLHKKFNQSQINDKKRAQELLSKDKQIAKLLEEIDRKNVSIVSSAAQQMKDKENEKLAMENKRLEKQKNELYAAFKKSLKLCSILKRQKVHLENARMLAFTEEEFKNLIEGK